MSRNDEDWAVFWCALLSPVLLGEIPQRQRERYFQELSQEERRLPNGQQRRISVRTFRRKWRELKDKGVPGLYRRRRSDRGKPRKKYADLLARAVKLKREQPYRSATVINRILKREFGRQVPRSTLYQHLKREGATRRKLGASKQKVRCRWTRDKPGALWVGDFEHGPLVMHQGQAIKTHLSAWIDCHPPRRTMSLRLATTFARIWTSWWIHCSAPGATTEPAKSCTSTTPRSTTPKR